MHEIVKNVACMSIFVLAVIIAFVGIFCEHLFFIEKINCLEKRKEKMNCFYFYDYQSLKIGYRLFFSFNRRSSSLVQP
jgi:hypothetical protein